MEVVEPADGDCFIDGNIDLNDFETFRGCVTGPAHGPLDEACQCADLDNDDVDLIDFRAFQLAFDGA